MKKYNDVRLFYKRPKNIEANAALQEKQYGELSAALDGALRLAYAGYEVKIVCNGYIVIEWQENYIKKITGG